MGCLLRNIKCLGLVGQIPVARKDFAEDRIQGLLDASKQENRASQLHHHILASASLLQKVDSRRADVPAAQVELDDGKEAFRGILNVGNGQKHFGMAHETVAQCQQSYGPE